MSELRSINDLMIDLGQAYDLRIRAKRELQRLLNIYSHSPHQWELVMGCYNEAELLLKQTLRDALQFA